MKTLWDLLWRVLAWLLQSSYPVYQTCFASWVSCLSTGNNITVLWATDADRLLWIYFVYFACFRLCYFWQTFFFVAWISVTTAPREKDRGIFLTKERQNLTVVYFGCYTFIRAGLLAENHQLDSGSTVLVLTLVGLRLPHLSATCQGIRRFTTERHQTHHQTP